MPQAQNISGVVPGDKSHPFGLLSGAGAMGDAECGGGSHVTQVEGRGVSTSHRQRRALVEEQVKAEGLRWGGRITASFEEAQKSLHRDCSGGPGATSPSFHHREHGFDHWSGN